MLHKIRVNTECQRVKFSGYTPLLLQRTVDVFTKRVCRILIFWKHQIKLFFTLSFFSLSFSFVDKNDLIPHSCSCSWFHICITCCHVYVFCVCVKATNKIIFSHHFYLFIPLKDVVGIFCGGTACECYMQCT